MKFKNLKVGECFVFKGSEKEPPGIATEYMKTQRYEVPGNQPSLGIKFNSIITNGYKIGHIRFIDRNYLVERV